MCGYDTPTKSRADNQSPMPNTLCVITLFSRALFGCGVFDDATPSPNAGWIVRNGIMTVTMPNANAGSSVGRASQLPDTRLTKTTANDTPIGAFAFI